ncbi:sigma-54-dependent transcriptional regulator [Bacteroidota bacterium]
MPVKKIRVLIIEDEDFDVRRIRNTIKPFLQNIEIKEVVSNGKGALDLIKSKPSNYDIIIMDYQIAGGLRGEDLIRSIKSIDNTLQIIVITKLTINISDFNFARGLMEAGAFWYCTKYPGDIEEYIYQPTDFVMSIFNAYDKRKLELQSYHSNKKLNKNIEDILDKRKIFSVSDTMDILKRDIIKLADSDINVLISGASGTGKELIANHIHYRSKRKFENFVPINCGSLPQDLIESELFGYEKGAFTGANTSKAGLFEMANKGTIFLDEIAELPPNAQVKLLRVIQDGELEKIGRTKLIKTDVRIIAATNKDLKNEVADKRFREDLYYRLNVMPIYILPLKERREDIPVLFDHFIEFYSLDMGKQVPVISEGVIEKFVSYEWPGNIRELKNIAQRLVFNSTGEITPEDLASIFLDGISNRKDKDDFFNYFSGSDIKPLKDVEKQFREKYFKFVRENSSSDAEAALKLGLAPPNYHRMCKELGLK